MNIFLFLSIVFGFTFIVGHLLEKIRIPWVFAALIFGSLLAISNPFQAITSSETITFLAQLGMYFLLFMIGLEINLEELKKKSGFIFKSSFFIIFLEAIFGSIIIHFVFDYSWFISSLVALSFATVGEAILIPILDEFKIVNTRLGQAIIGIGTIDDIIEIIILIIAISLVGAKATGSLNIGLILISLAVLFLLTISLHFLKKEGKKFNFFNIETLFLLAIVIFFLFLGIGAYSEATALAAVLAGIGIKSFIPTERLNLITNEVKTMTYGFFAPLFFLWVGVSIDIKYLLASPLLVLLIVVVSNGAKLAGSYIMGAKELGSKGSILLGIGLSVRFSTSIIIIKILFDNNIINSDLYSAIVASSIAFKFIVPVLFSFLIVKWKEAVY